MLAILPTLFHVVNPDNTPEVIDSQNQAPTQNGCGCISRARTRLDSRQVDVVIVKA